MSAENPVVERLRIPSSPKELEAALLIKEVRELFEQFKREVPRKKGQWPESIRSRVIALWKMGVRTHQIALEAKVPVQTLYSWRRRLKETGFSELPVVRHRRRTEFQRGLDERRLDHRSTLQPLEINKPMTRGSEAITVSVYTPDGIKIEGIPLFELNEVIRVLRA